LFHKGLPYHNLLRNFH